VSEAERRRRRVRHPVEADQHPEGEAVAHSSAVLDPEPVDEREVERGLRGLVGSGSSQVSTGAAMRARDAARATDEEVTAAQEQLVIIRRGWVPREDLPRGPRSG
jgi:hypothetical protein